MMKIFFSCCCLLFSSVLQAQDKQYRIVYNVFEDREKDNYDVYSMNMDGSDKKNLTNTPGVEWAYYAYKDKVYFVSDKDTCHRCYFLYEMDALGQHKRKVSALQLEDSWMGSRNNGTEMIVLGRIGRLVRNQLFLVNLINGSYKQITGDTVSTKRDPMLLPDGQQVVMSYRPDKALRMTVPDELWKFDLLEKADGSVSLSKTGLQLTHFPAGDTSTKWYEYHAGPPQWHPVKKFISYMSKQQGQGQIFAVSRDGKKQWQLTPWDSLSSGWHSWSTDGKWLAMDKSTHEGKGFDIYLMQYKTKMTVRLTSDEKAEMAPVIVEIKKP